MMSQQGTVDTTQMMSASRFLEMSIAQSFLKLAVGFLSDCFLWKSERQAERFTSYPYIWNFVGVQCFRGMEHHITILIMVNSQKRYCILIDELLQGAPLGL